MLIQLKEKFCSWATKYSDRFYERSVRKRLKNDDFSIICSNCIGGTIYHRLGKEFKSPTINMWIHQTDFLRFVSDLKRYLHEDLVFSDSEYDYPVAQIGGDVTLYFNHSKTKEEAAAGWNRRKERVSYDNIYIIMYDRDGITEEDIRSLERIPCKNKVVLSDKKHEDIPFVVTIKPNLNRINGAQFMDKDFKGKRTYEKYFDYVSFLNKQ